MAKPLRYSGCWPPIEILDEYPNWTYALDEEGEPDQDETTIKPESQQAFISDETDFTAATVVLANGTSAPGILCLTGGVVDGISVFDGEDWWRLDRDHHRENWTPFIETWLPEHKRSPVVSLSDSDLFPAIVTSRVPLPSNSALRFSIQHQSSPADQPQQPWYKFWK